MEEISISEFKAKCLRLLDGVATKGDRIVVTKRGHPIARVERAVAPKVRVRGLWKDKMRIKGDIVYFSDDSWESESE